ncbi:N-acetylmuramic acid 6-phosphate etherase [Meridianimarinicoccus roseus]|uniref:N-acetylmuramic acid 6-phosphate etherase n=1 Tax=Meridianimarinicoccus roseus TaxID=2072018 RepID=A0A2V2L791_9RHOB|nr:N-acetylmuramic acid 6-phosphate etherase [Meridianimarinicoccus roseus]PWR00975.1 N-acetylmuramic acid 6-phosphate etherase [Meridianimarinicoccus roseus]
MDSPPSEPDSEALDALPPTAALDLLLGRQQAALAAVRGALPALQDGAALMARSLRSGGKVVYAGAGSSGLMAMADAMELPGTFGIQVAQIGICMAGGLPRDAHMPGGTEDETEDAAREAALLGPHDTAIVVTASGSTPFALAFARTARMHGATVIGLAGPPDAVLFAHADVAVCLRTPPEPLAGSTRMGAGTAQKAALNMMSTLAGVALGHVHDGQMVNLRADNIKLRDRARAMVARIGGVGEERAAALLDATGGEVKPAIALASGAPDPGTARRIIADAQGHLRAALAELNRQPQRQTGRPT